MTQLRRYTINRGKMDAFVEAWVVRERNEFVWLMSYDGDDWEAKDKAYYASPERSTLDPAQFIARVEHWFVTPLLAG